MAIEREFVKVVVPKSALKARFKGSLDDFAELASSCYLEDEHLESFEQP